MENRFIHPSAVIEPGAKVANDVIIGPFSYIGGEVILHSGVEIKATLLSQERLKSNRTLLFIHLQLSVKFLRI